MITFNGSASSSDGTVSGSAAFTTSAGQIQIVLTNTLSPLSLLVSAGQALSGITFTLSNDPGALGTATATGQLGNFTETTSVTYIAGNPTNWVDAGSITGSGNTRSMTTIGGGQPTHMILPFVANGGSYPNDNSSVDNFIPYVIGPGTFTLAFPGITANTTVTAVTFRFGTEQEHSANGTPGAGGTGGGGQTVPEPASLALFGAALLGLGYRARRNRT